jgi:hypothetical protein
LVPPNTGSGAAGSADVGGVPFLTFALLVLGLSAIGGAMVIRSCYLPAEATSKRDDST